MGRLTATQAAPLPEAEFALPETLDGVKFLMEQLRGMDAPQMTRVKIPSAGGGAFTIPNGTDESEVATSITGLIVLHHATNAYWDKAYGESAAQAPICSSADGVWGMDSDGCEYQCRRCERNRMGSAPDGNGKLCKNMVRLLILRECDALPIEMILPPMSLPNFGAYLAKLAPMRLTPMEVVTCIKLARAVNKRGTEYRKAQFQAVGTIDKALAESLRQSMRQVLLPASADDDSNTTAEVAV